MLEVLFKLVCSTTPAVECACTLSETAMFESLAVVVARVPWVAVRESDGDTHQHGNGSKQQLDPRTRLLLQPRKRTRVYEQRITIPQRTQKLALYAHTHTNITRVRVRTQPSPRQTSNFPFRGRSWALTEEQSGTRRLSNHAAPVGVPFAGTGGTCRHHRPRCASKR